MIIITFINLEHLKYKNKGFWHTVYTYTAFTCTSFPTCSLIYISAQYLIRGSLKVGQNKRSKSVSAVQLHSILAGDYISCILWERTASTEAMELNL